MLVIYFRYIKGAHEFISLTVKLRLKVCKVTVHYRLSYISYFIGIFFYPQRTNLSDVSGSDTKGNVFTSDVEYSSSPDQNDTAIITGLS